MNLQKALEFNEVSSCAQIIHELSFTHSRITIKIISWLDQFLCCLLLIFKLWLHSWRRGIHRATNGVGGWVRCSVLGLEKLQKFGRKRHVFTIKACLPFHSPGTQLAHSAVVNVAISQESLSLRDCVKEALNQTVVAGYKIHDLFKKLLLLYLKGFCWAQVLLCVGSLQCKQVTSDLCVPSTTSPGRQGWGRLRRPLVCPSSESDDSGHRGLVKDDELNVQLVLIIAG